MAYPAEGTPRYKRYLDEMLVVFRYKMIWTDIYSLSGF